MKTIIGSLLLVAALCSADRQAMVRRFLQEAVNAKEDERKLIAVLSSVGQRCEASDHCYANYFGQREFVISVCNGDGTSCWRANQTKEVCPDTSESLRKMARNTYVLEMAYQQETGAFSMHPDSIGFDTGPSSGYKLVITKATKERYEGTLCSIRSGECVAINEQGEGPKRTGNACRRISDKNTRSGSSEATLFLQK
jgi:hypothetical protein